MSPFVAGLIVGILITAAAVTFTVSARTLRYTREVLRSIQSPQPTTPASPPAGAQAAAVRGAVRTSPRGSDAPLSSSPPRLDDDVTGRHASGAPSSPRGPVSPEREVERTHLMRAVQAERPIRVANPTGLNEKAIAAALTRGVTRPSR